MKIYDCFMYYNEDVVLEARLNILDNFVDYFVIVESKYSHSGELREPHFDISKFKNFKKKIIYILSSNLPSDLEKLNNNNSVEINDQIQVRNSVKIENFHRNEIMKGLKKCNNYDVIMISDIDEIPNCKNINFNKLKKKIIIFKQRFFNYKFNLEDKNYKWFGTRMCLYKNLKSPQWLRNIKAKKYPFWRLDILFNEKKFISLSVIENGGWHFSFIKNPEQIIEKLSNWLHHIDYKLHKISINEINELINKGFVLYNYNADKKSGNKFRGNKMVEINISELPEYFMKNKIKLREWLV